MNKGKLPPDKRQSFQQHPLARFRCAGTHQLCRPRAERLVAGGESGQPGAKHRHRRTHRRIIPSKRRHRIRQIIHNAVCPDNHPRKKLESHRQPDGASYHACRNGIKQILGDNRPFSVSKRLHGADLRTLLLYHSGHGRQADKRRHQNEKDREHLGDCVHLFGVLLVTGIAGIVVPVPDVPHRLS